MNRTILTTAFLMATTAAPVHARVKLLLFAPGTTMLSAMEQIGFNANAFFKAQPRCNKDAYYPCRRKPIDGQYVGHGIPNGEGSCLLPTMYVFAGKKEFSVSITINATCGLRFHNFGPTLSFPDKIGHRPGGYHPESISFPDPDNEGPWWDFQPLIGIGQKIQRRRWVKVRTSKTRILAGIDIEERLAVGITPTLSVLKWHNWSKLMAEPNVWRKAGYQPLLMNPTPTGPYTVSNTTVGSFYNVNTNLGHTLIAQVLLGPKAAQQGGCQWAGTFPVDGQIFCDQRWSVLSGPKPL